MFVRHADEAYNLGPTATVDADGKRTGAYLELRGPQARPDRDARPTPSGPAGASWPSTPRSPTCRGAWASSSSARSGDVMRTLGDKIQSKLMAEKAGVPVAPWSNGPVETIEEAREHARAHRLPADDQGGGRRRRARHPQGQRRRTASSTR